MTTPLTSQYVLLPVLQQLFVDKDTNELLANGYVWFFQDNQRTVGQPVYTITGSPPNYDVIEYGAYVSSPGSAWQVDINADGALNNALYFYPYLSDGVTVSNYFIQVYNSLGVLQFTLEDWPGIPTGSGTGDLITENLVPNPQFLLHYSPNAIPITGTSAAKLAGQIVAQETPIAYGGWLFEEPVGFNSIDTVTFNRIGSPISNPVGNPRYEVVVTCVTPTGGTFKYLSLRFQDVNKFSNTENVYTFGFSAFCNSTLAVGAYVLQHFGSGGSPSADQLTLLANFNISNAITPFAISGFTFPDTTGFTLGNNNDDYMEIVLAFPTNTAFTFTATNFLLSPGNIANPTINDQPDSVYQYQANAGLLQNPDPTGMSLALPIIQGQEGFAYDYSNIGKIYPTINANNNVRFFGELPCDGSQYDSLMYNPLDLIPYLRLSNVLYNGTINAPITGTGKQFVTLDALTVAANNQLTLVANTPGATTAAANGTSSPVFTYTPLATPGYSGADFLSFYGGTNLVYLQATIAGVAENSIITGAGGIFINDLSIIDGNPTAQQTNFTLTRPAYGANVREQFAIQTVAASALVPGGGGVGRWFAFVTPPGGHAGYYAWYTVNGVGTDPAPTGLFGIKIPLLSTYTANDVAKITNYILAGYQTTNIVVGAGSTIPAGSYFNFYSLSAPSMDIGYYGWFNVSGSGTDPMVAGKTGIQINILTADTAPQVLLKIQMAINMRFFAVPNLQGMFLRGLDPTGLYDTDVASRFSYYGYNSGANLATFQLDSNQQHTHFITGNNAGGDTIDGLLINPSVPAPLQAGFDLDGLHQGQSQSRPLNFAVNYVIKY